MAERSDDCSSDQDMESGPVEDPPLLVSPHRGEDQQSTELQRSGDTGRQVQGVSTAEPKRLSTRLATMMISVSNNGGFMGPINFVKVDLKQTCTLEERLDNEVRPKDKVRPEDQVGPDNMFRTNDGIRPNDDRKTGVEVTSVDEVRKSEEVRLDSVNVHDEPILRNNLKPLQSKVHTDSEAVQGDIFEAAQSGDVQTVKNYLDLGISPDLVDEEGWSILHHAASHDRVDVMRMLHSKGCCVDPRDRYGRTPLHYAASNGACASIGVMVKELGSEVNPVDEDGFTPLKWSVECEQYAVSKELLRCLSKTNLFQSGGTVHIFSKVIMLESAKVGDVQNMLAMLHCGCPIDVVDSDAGWSALHFAAVGGAVEMIRFLIKCGLDVNRGDKTGRTALHVAAEYGHQKVVSALVDANCPLDVVDSNGWSALHYAAWGGAVEMIHFLIKCGLDVNRGDKTGRTALHVAAQYGHQKVVSALVDANCPIDVVDNSDSSALHWAAVGGAVRMISFLIDGENFDVNSESKDGVTPLHGACFNCQPQAAFELLRHGARLTKVAGRYGTPLHQAAVKGGRASLIDDILKFQSEQLYSGSTTCNGYQESTNPLDVCDSFGETPAFWAVDKGCIGNLERLVVNNCDITVRSNVKFSLFESAIRGGLMSQLQTVVSACGIDAGSTSQIDLLHTIQGKDLLDPKKLLILGAISGDPLVIDSLSSEENMFTAAAHEVLSDTYCRMLLEMDFWDDEEDTIYDGLCLPSACQLTPLQIAIIFLKYRTAYSSKVKSKITRIGQASEFIQALIIHPVSKFTVNVQFDNGLSPLDVAQQFGLHDIADMIESAGGRPGMWADLPKEVQISGMQLFSSKQRHHLLSQGPIGLAALSRVIEGWVGVSPQLQFKSQQTSVDAVLHQKPTRKLLIKHVLPRIMIRKKWRSLYTLLDLEEEQVLKYRDQDDDDPYQAVLFAWLQLGSQVSWERLFDAVGTFETEKTVKEMMAKILEELQPSVVTSPPTPSPVSMPLALPPHHGVQTLAIGGPAPHRSREELASRPLAIALRKICDKTGRNWKNLLISLEIEEVKIQTLVEDNPRNTAEACFQGLMFWENENALLPVTWGTLIEALKNAKLTKLANELPPKEK